MSEAVERDILADGVLGGGGRWGFVGRGGRWGEGRLGREGMKNPRWGNGTEDFTEEAGCCGTL